MVVSVVRYYVKLLSWNMKHEDGAGHEADSRGRMSIEFSIVTLYIHMFYVCLLWTASLFLIYVIMKLKITSDFSLLERRDESERGVSCSASRLPCDGVNA